MTDEMVKIEFRVEDSDGGTDVETLWATPMGNNRYRVENSPWFAYGVSFLDIVRALPAAEGFPVFECVVEKSGNYTVRMILETPAEEGNRSANILSDLVALGASYEGANGKFIALNIESQADFQRVCRFLTDNNLRWEHADPTYEALYPNSGD